MVIKAAQKAKGVESNMAGPEPGVKKPGAKKTEALWVMTFADLSFILMCFFALLLSMSTLNVKRADSIVEGIDQNKHKKTRSLASMYEMIKREIKKRKLEDKIGVKLDADGLAVEFKSAVLFKSGSARINPRFNKLSGQIMSIIAKAPKKYRLNVEGHTDDTGRELANWNLSSKRGIAMLNQFKARGVRMEKMRVIAYAATNPKIDVKGKKGAALKRARAANRRVVIRLN